MFISLKQTSLPYWCAALSWRHGIFVLNPVVLVLKLHQQYCLLILCKFVQACRFLCSIYTSPLSLHCCSAMAPQQPSNGCSWVHNAILVDAVSLFPLYSYSLRERKIFFLASFIGTSSRVCGTLSSIKSNFAAISHSINCAYRHKSPA